MDKLYTYIINALVSIVIVLIGMTIVKRATPRIVQVNLVAITTHYAQLMAKDTLSNDTQMKKISDTVRNNLEPIISDYVRHHHVVVIQSQAIVAGKVPDLTDYVITQLDKRM